MAAFASPQSNGDTLRSRAAVTLRRLSLNDWMLVIYLGYLVVAISRADPGPARDAGLTQMSVLVASCVVALALVRGHLLGLGLANAVIYRVAHFGGLIGSYFSMRSFLPAVAPGSVDWLLHEMDLALFGLEPCVALSARVTPGLTEWFSFFYYGYFFILGLHCIPILFFGRHPRLLAEFGLGMFFVLGVGQSLYLAVPGFGPYKTLEVLSQHPLPAGAWWNLVTEIVQSGGAQKDIFPSIHTAAPSFILLFSFRNRRYAPYRYTWPLLAVCVINIIAATMFLRWHWLIDVVAGLGLAFFAHVASAQGGAWEARVRASHGVEPAWPPLPR